MKTITLNGRTFTCPFVDAVPQPTPEERDALREDIRRNGVIVPVVVDEMDNVIDGHNRLEIAAELGLADVPIKTIAPGLSDEQKREMAEDINIHRRQLTREQIRQIIERRLKAKPDQSDRGIASKVGVDNKTVAAVRRDLEATEEIPQLQMRTDQRGQKRPATKPAPTPKTTKAGPARAPTPPTATPSPYQWTYFRSSAKRFMKIGTDMTGYARAKERDRDLNRVKEDIVKVRAEADALEQAIAPNADAPPAADTSDNNGNPDATPQQEDAATANQENAGQGKASPQVGEPAQPPVKMEEERIQSGWQGIVRCLLGLADKKKQQNLVLDLLTLFGQHFPTELKAAAKTAKQPPKQKELPKHSHPDMFEQAEDRGGVLPDPKEMTPQEDKPAELLPALVAEPAPSVTTPPPVVEQPVPAVTLTEQLPSQAEPLPAEPLSKGGPSGTEEPEWAVEVVEEAEDTIMATGETELLKKLNTERYILNEVMREHGISWPVETDTNDRYVWRKYDYDPLHRAIEEDRRKREESGQGTSRKAG